MNKRTAQTLADVAKLAEVSEITVSRVLRDKGPISQRTRERVMRAVRETGYLPNRIAGTLASSGSSLVGVVLPSLSNIVFPEVLRGIHAALAASGHQPVVGVTDYDEAEEERLVAALLAWQPAAMIVTGLDHTETTLRLLRGTAVRVAEVMDIDGTPVDLAVGLSHRAAGRATIRHLWGRGYRRFGYVGHDRARDRRAGRRYEGLRDGLAEAGGGFIGEAVFDGPSSAAAGRRALAELLAGGSRPDVVVFSNDDMAVGGAFHCLADGIAPKRELGLFGFNGLEIGEALPMPLSTLRSHRFSIGETAARRILAEPRPALPESVDTGFEIVEGATA